MLTFRMKISHKELEQFTLRMLVLENQINSKEEKYFSGMVKNGNNYYLEFVVPEVTEKQDNSDII